MNSHHIVQINKRDVAESLKQYSKLIDKGISDAATELIAEALEDREKAKRRDQWRYELKKTKDEIADFKSNHTVPNYDRESDELDADMIELLRRAGVHNVYHGVAARLIEDITRTDVELLRRYALTWVQSNQHNGALLDRIAKALELLAKEARHDRRG